MMQIIPPEQLIDFWFSQRVQKMWFNSTQDFDKELYNDYYQTYESAVNGDLDHWSESSLGSLALVIILDQFPLNMFRNSPRCFESENKALQAAKDAIKNKQDLDLANEQKMFIYMPFMHSENLQDQDKAVELFAVAELDENLKFAKHHRDIIRNYGRFPHRNAILGRTSTAEETAYLESGSAFLG